MSAEFDSEKFEGSIRTLDIFQARHLASQIIAELSQQGNLGIVNVLERCSQQSGLLSPEEIKLCMNSKMTLPYPLYAPWPTDKYVSIDLWNIKVDMELEKGKRVYVVTGFFDVFHGGHWSYIQSALFLAHINKFDKEHVRNYLTSSFSFTSNDHLKYLLNVIDGNNSETSISDGEVMVRLEQDRYKTGFKESQEIFPIGYRGGWFEQFPVKWVTQFPTTQSGVKSWEEGNQMLKEPGWLTDEELAHRFMFVLPYLPSCANASDIEALNRREAQIRNYGFGVVRVPSVVTDVSSSKLIEKLSLKPVLI